MFTPVLARPDQDLAPQLWPPRKPCLRHCGAQKPAAASSPAQTPGGWPCQRSTARACPPVFRREHHHKQIWRNGLAMRYGWTVSNRLTMS